MYSSHNYTAAGFGPGKYPGEFFGSWRDRAAYREVFATQQGTQFAQQHNVPLWVGEFGSVYNGRQDEVPDRLRALDDQIDILEEFGAHWTTWTYKDVGVMGWVTLDAESEYMQLMKPLHVAESGLETNEREERSQKSRSLVELGAFATELDSPHHLPDTNYSVFIRAPCEQPRLLLRKHFLAVQAVLPAKPLQAVQAVAVQAVQAAKAAKAAPFHNPLRFSS